MTLVDSLIINSFPGMKAQLVGLRTICTVELTNICCLSFCVLSGARVCSHVLCVPFHLHLASELLYPPGQAQQRHAPHRSPARKFRGCERLRSQHVPFFIFESSFHLPKTNWRASIPQTLIGHLLCARRSAVCWEHKCDIHVWSLTSWRSKAIHVNSSICSVVI